MKNFLFALSLMFSGVALAEELPPVFPEVFNFGHSVQVTVRNYTEQNVTCSGTIYLVTMSGFRETLVYNEFVPARTSSYKNFYPRFITDRILRTSNMIFCQ